MTCCLEYVLYMLRGRIGRVGTALGNVLRRLLCHYITMSSPVRLISCHIFSLACRDVRVSTIDPKKPQDPIANDRSDVKSQD